MHINQFAAGKFTAQWLANTLHGKGNIVEANGVAGTSVDTLRRAGAASVFHKYPGIHIAFGNPYGAHTGADWYSSTHIDVVGRNFDIWVDDQQIMRGSQFLVEA